MKLAWAISRHAPASQRHQARPAVLGLLARKPEPVDNEGRNAGNACQLGWIALERFLRRLRLSNPVDDESPSAKAPATADSGRRQGGLSPADLLMIALAGGGMIGWIVADEPVIATACVVAADLIGAAIMVPKTYRDPGSETLATFALASLSGALAAGALTPSLLLYPVYYCLVNGAIAVLILHRRSLLAGPQPTSSPARTFP